MTAWGCHSDTTEIRISGRGVTQTNPCACQAFTQTSPCACQAFVLTVVGRFLFSGARPRHSEGSQGAVRAAQAERRQGLAGDAGRGAALFSAGSCADGGEDRRSPSLPTDHLTYSPIDSPTDSPTDWLTVWPTVRPTDSPTDRQSGRPTDRPTNWHSDELTLRLTGWHQGWDKTASHLPLLVASFQCFFFLAVNRRS